MTSISGGMREIQVIHSVHRALAWMLSHTHNVGWRLKKTLLFQVEETVTTHKHEIPKPGAGGSEAYSLQHSVSFSELKGPEVNAPVYPAEIKHNFPPDAPPREAAPGADDLKFPVLGVEGKHQYVTSGFHIDVIPLTMLFNFSDSRRRPPPRWRRNTCMVHPMTLSDSIRSPSLTPSTNLNLLYLVLHTMWATSTSIHRRASWTSRKLQSRRRWPSRWWTRITRSSSRPRRRRNRPFPRTCQDPSSVLRIASTSTLDWIWTLTRKGRGRSPLNWSPRFTQTRSATWKLTTLRQIMINVNAMSMLSPLWRKYHSCLQEVVMHAEMIRLLQVNPRSTLIW